MTTPGFCMHPKLAAVPSACLDAEQLPGFGGRGRAGAELGALVGSDPDRFGVTGGEALLSDPDVVFQAGADMATQLQRPAAQLKLMPPDAGSNTRMTSPAETANPGGSVSSTSSGVAPP